MKRVLNIALLLVLAVAALSVSCSSKGSKYKVSTDTPLRSESDSLAYIIGMNVARELQKMDSLINYEVVCRAIMEYSQSKPLMSEATAREQYLRYILHVEPERRRSIEERFLVDLAARDRSFTRTNSGLTYNIMVIGDESMQPKLSKDWLKVKYYVTRTDGSVVYPVEGADESVEEVSDSAADTAVDTTAMASTLDVEPIKRGVESVALSDLPLGAQEALKMIGVGGRVKAWMPSKLGYGDLGDEERGVGEMETLYYDIELIELERNAADKHKQDDF